jgi:hypothetical protein
MQGGRRWRKRSGCRARSQGAAGRRGRASGGAASNESFRVEDGDVVGEDVEAGCQSLLAQVALVDGGREGVGLVKLPRQVLNEEAAVVQLCGEAREARFEAVAHGEFGGGYAGAHPSLDFVREEASCFSGAGPHGRGRVGSVGCRVRKREDRTKPRGDGADPPMG